MEDKKNTNDFKYLKFEEPPAFNGHKSLMAATLTPELFSSLKDVTTRTGYSLSNVILTGVVNPHLRVGCTAGDEESWEKFKDLFYPIIKLLHQYDPETQKHSTDLDPSHLVFSEQQNTLFGEYVVSTKIRSARNFTAYALPSGSKVLRNLWKMSNIIFGS